MTKEEIQSQILQLSGQLSDYARVTLECELTINLMVNSARQVSQQVAFLKDELTKIQDPEQAPQLVLIEDNQ